MKLKIERFHFSEKCTIGSLSIDGQSVGVYTLEDCDREIDDDGTPVPVGFWKVQNETAIPRGVYKVIIEHSAHFGIDLPLLLNVPGFSGVRIHPGNTDKDTEGCILVGLTWSGADSIGNSRAAFGPLFEKIKAAINVTIEIA